MPLFDPQRFREIISGRRRGPTAWLWRCVMAAVEVPYTFEVQRRNHQYDSGKRKVHRVGVPVVSVGNITLGGTGKTPMVEWIARWFRERGVRVCLISRGYGAQEGSRNDEALELEQKLPDVPHVQNPDRVAAAHMAIEEFETQLILLDDAFQHRRIHRDLDIVLLDATEPFGFERVFPRGTLREPLMNLERADIAALTRADMVDEQARAACRDRVQQIQPDMPWLELAHAPRALVNANGQEDALSSLAGKRVAAFSGIGNPAGFRHTLDSCGCEIAAWREFPDHHNYRREDITSLSHWADDSGAEAMVCTQKDLVKINVEQLGSIPLWAIAVGMEFICGRDVLESRLEQLLPLIETDQVTA